MKHGFPADSASCDECQAPATCVLAYFVDRAARSAPLCERCWLARRHVVGAEMLEGPISWGEDWPEVTTWLARTLALAPTRRLRHLTAVELARQVPHLPAPIPRVARELLDEFGLAAS